ncbi:MAG: hypothetical protein H7338_20720, partial [Candidatus Sericytochromatia bacterium]|nr:hypothetical protein [Candidatus Sericytochromatia bacterium]
VSVSAKVYMKATSEEGPYTEVVGPNTVMAPPLHKPSPVSGHAEDIPPPPPLPAPTRQAPTRGPLVVSDESEAIGRQAEQVPDLIVGGPPKPTSPISV